MALSTIKPAGGGDYTTFAAWVAAVQLNGDQEDADCYAGGDLGELVLDEESGWTNTGSIITGKDSPLGINKTADRSSVSWIGLDIYCATSVTIHDFFIDYPPIWFRNFGHGTHDVVFYNNVIDVNFVSNDLISLVAFSLDPVSASGGISCVLRNNVVYWRGPDNGGTSAVFSATAQQGGDGDGPPVSVTLYNNTFCSKQDGDGSTTPFYGMKWNDGGWSYTVICENNAVFSTVAGGADYILVDNGTPAVITAFNNNLSHDATAGTFGGTGNLASQTTSGLVTDRQLNAYPQTGSALIDAGKTEIGFSTDIAGTTRPQQSAWDIGAFEWILPPPVFGGGGGRFWRHRRRG